MDEPEMGEDSRFATARDRRANYSDVEATVTRWVKSRTREELWSTLSRIGLSSAPVLSFAEAIQDSHLQARDAFVEVDHPQAGRLTLLAPWVRFSRTPSRSQEPAPLVGQHNREVFCDQLGLDEDEYRALVDDGVI
jgi:crotonobetainyl-CoA:carnitine CoA-transferase CaiB-like acyl-CoA transferase